MLKTLLNSIPNSSIFSSILQTLKLGIMEYVDVQINHVKLGFHQVIDLLEHGRMIWKEL
jgi:hypothetical protein